MTPEMEDRYQALADFMEWVDPAGYAEATAPTARVMPTVPHPTTPTTQQED